MTPLTKIKFGKDVNAVIKFRQMTYAIKNKMWSSFSLLRQIVNDEHEDV